MLNKLCTISIENFSFAHTPFAERFISWDVRETRIMDGFLGKGVRGLFY